MKEKTKTKEQKVWGLKKFQSKTGRSLITHEQIQSLAANSKEGDVFMIAHDDNRPYRFIKLFNRK